MRKGEKKKKNSKRLKTQMFSTTVTKPGSLTCGDWLSPCRIWNNIWPMSAVCASFGAPFYYLKISNILSLGAFFTMEPDILKKYTFSPLFSTHFKNISAWASCYFDLDVTFHKTSSQRIWYTHQSGATSIFWGVTKASVPLLTSQKDTFPQPNAYIV